MSEHAIDREAVVSRHNIRLEDSPLVLVLGSGELCFGADRTGLQTFNGNTMAHWAWHSFPMEEGLDRDFINNTGLRVRGRLTGDGSIPADPEHDAELEYMRQNAHPYDLARLSLTDETGVLLRGEDVTASHRTLDLWRGELTTDFLWKGIPVSVRTVVQQSSGEIGVRIETEAPLCLGLDFPYPTIAGNVTAGDFTVPEKHETEWAPCPGGLAFSRRIDPGAQSAAEAVPFTRDGAFIGYMTHNGASHRLAGPHGMRIPVGGALEARLGMWGSADPLIPQRADYETMAAMEAYYMREFWMSGGAIDLSESTDPRWFELERRIVVSQYVLHCQSAGSWPCGEAGLTFIDGWCSRFHMEMVYWHAAHWFMWGRPELADGQLECYAKHLPVAEKLARQMDYDGAYWGKCCDPSGRTAPRWCGNAALLWREPHPMTFAELEYRCRPTEQTLAKWAKVLDRTARFMADVPVRDASGVYHLDPVMPPSEVGFTKDTVFDLVYWQWGLRTANLWRERMGLERVAKWDEIADRLAPLPTVPDADGAVYVRSPEWTATYVTGTYEHPDMVGVIGMIPESGNGLADRDITRRTLRKIWKLWQKDRIWGWDFPWIAMCASRTDEPEIAVEAMLAVDIDEAGFSGRGSYPYLPANGALLYAAAMMARGRDGEEAPGFTAGFTVRAEGLLPW